MCHPMVRRPQGDAAQSHCSLDEILGAIEVLAFKCLHCSKLSYFEGGKIGEFASVTI